MLGLHFGSISKYLEGATLPLPLASVDELVGGVVPAKLKLKCWDLIVGYLILVDLLGLVAADSSMISFQLTMNLRTNR